MDEVEPEKPTMSSLELLQTQRLALYDQILDLLESVYPYADSAFALSCLTHLFFKTSRTGALDGIRQLLDRRIRVFGPDPASESDLPDKTLAMATYFNLSCFMGFERTFPDSFLIDYIEYAQEENWYDDSILALYCTLLVDEIQACATAHDYFEEGWDFWVSRKHLARICQGLIALDDRLSPSQVRVAVDLIQEREKPSLSLEDLSWVLLALSKLAATGRWDDVQKDVDRLSDEVADAILSRLQSQVTRQFRQLYGLAYLLSSEFTRNELLDSWSTGEPTVFSPVTSLGYRDGQIVLRMAETALDLEGQPESMVAMALSLIALESAQRDSLVGVIKPKENELRALVETGRRAKLDSVLMLSQPQALIANLTSLIATLLIGTGLALYVAGVDLDLDFSRANWREWDALAVFGFTVFFTIMGIATWIRNGSVMHGLMLMPIVDAVKAIPEAIRARQSQRS
jgi:hypothetical protein